MYSTPWKRPNIALGYQSRSGKSTAASWLCGQGYRRISIAKPVYDIHNLILEHVGCEVKKTPALLQLIGQGLRDIISSDIWIDAACREIDSVGNWPIVIDDLRYRNEAEKLKQRGFILIKIVRNDRPIDRDQNHISEIDLKDYVFDHVIENNGTVYDLDAKLAAILQEYESKNCTEYMKRRQS